ncbi:hypothetical protein HanHA300_Chr08g0271521 [Helianthus annuus]|nr:hypothetical protein HanHA300_Chr08g0271521 [Helianthus annuus]
MVTNIATVPGFVGLRLRRSCCDRIPTACLLQTAIVFRPLVFYKLRPFCNYLPFEKLRPFLWSQFLFIF